MSILLRFPNAIIETIEESESEVERLTMLRLIEDEFRDKEDDGVIAKARKAVLVATGAEPSDQSGVVSNSTLDGIQIFNAMFKQKMHDMAIAIGKSVLNELDKIGDPLIRESLLYGFHPPVSRSYVCKGELKAASELCSRCINAMSDVNRVATVTSFELMSVISFLNDEDFECRDYYEKYTELARAISHEGGISEVEIISRQTVVEGHRMKLQSYPF